MHLNTVYIAAEKAEFEASSSGSLLKHLTKLFLKTSCPSGTQRLFLRSGRNMSNILSLQADLYNTGRDL